ncbi:DNA-3-methyladenine glycosylase 2 family protein [Nostoc sp. ChiSLP03a]|uniref:DNA-3-methyladenine glycosylase family protein n=1 Tax=Nostoc sp. ChiSLP03a TaxID=3075380 RepID=UPI002AD3CD6A|nr:DNA-3-methyladenine glycosylase 2 family protein [Nostoc sp. ChiSLP03a]MDZ8214981.1 DNA-3-methyladenine glycosylase 2 family protein [Nostoc sp. ChiSLP03a]
MTVEETAAQTLKLESLTEESLTRGLMVLAKLDSDLAGILETLGPPPIWSREAGFATLLCIILEQQVSVAAARAVFTRLCAVVVTLTPENFLILDDAQLKAIGFSRQKILYCRGLANAIATGQLDLTKLQTMDETTIRTELKRLKGIGDWTVDIYLLMALQRPDVFPKGDLAIAIALQKLKNLATRPTPAQLEAMTQHWRPWRAVAARLLWHYYLNKGLTNKKISN